MFRSQVRAAFGNCCLQQLAGNPSPPAQGHLHIHVSKSVSSPICWKAGSQPRWWSLATTSSPWTPEPGRRRRSTWTRLGRPDNLRNRYKINSTIYGTGTKYIVQSMEQVQNTFNYIWNSSWDTKKRGYSHTNLFKPPSRNNSLIQVRSLLTNCTYLEDESLEVRNVIFFIQDDL